jgi:small subunit ribosomal protein S4e
MPIAKKVHKFVYNTMPGPHPKMYSLPLGVVLRDVMKLCDNGREVNFVLQRGDILIDGKPRRHAHFPVGLMDVISIPRIQKYWRVLPKLGGGILMHETTEAESKFKLCQIVDKRYVNGGKLQLNLHDGRNVVIFPEDPNFGAYKTRGTLKIEVPSQKILEYYPMSTNSPALIVRGHNTGIAGTIKDIVKRYGHNASVSRIETAAGSSFNTAYAYTFVVGATGTAIELPNQA